MTIPIDDLPSLHASPEVDAELVTWRLPAGPRITVVAKIAFALEPGVVRKLLPGAPLADRDRHRDRSPSRSLEEASDLAPLMPGGEVLVVGHAYAPRGRAISITAQVQITRKEVVQLSKRIHVVGDRDDGGAVVPFQKMPLSWERAVRTPSNPVGVDPARAAPNLMHPDDPTIAAGFGPIDSVWPDRARRLKGMSRNLLEAVPLELPAGFDFEFFRAAPDDQRVPLKGDEWIVLEGLHPLLPQLATRLPGAVIVARFVQPKGRPLKVLPLLPDRLVIDTDHHQATLTYRAGFAIDWTTLAKHRVEIGLSTSGETLRFPDHKDPLSFRGHSRRAMRPAAPSTGAGGTTDMTDALAQPALPFAPPSSPRIVPAPPSAPIIRTTDMTDALTQPALPFATTSTPRVPPSVPVEPSFRRDDAPGLDEHTIDATAPVAAPLPFGGQLGGPPSQVAELGPIESKLPSVPPPPPPARPTSPAAEQSDRLPSDVVPTLCDGPLDVTAFHWQIAPPQDCLVIVVKGSFQLIQGGPAAIRDEAETVLGDSFAGDGPDTALLHADDFAIHKPEVDVLLEGTAYAPGGSASAMQITMRVRGQHGSIDRAIAVFGDRIWRGGALSIVPSDPTPFSSIPITYQRAFGGPGFDDNPHGQGYRGAPGPDGVRRLPNFEQMGKLIASPSDTPDPESFSAIHPLWPTRANLLGTCDTEWFHSRWPYFPEDLDPRAFQAAPPDQRLPSVMGDEEYELGGVHPKHPMVKGRLPALRVRVFAQRTRAAGGAFSEIPVRIDTITFAPDDDAMHLLWRGVIDVTDDDAPELAHIFATTEPLAGPAITLDEARARYLASLAKPEVDEAEAVEPAEEETTTDDSDEEARKIEAEIAEYEAKVREMNPPDPEDGAADVPLPTPDLESIAQVMREGGAEEEDIAEIAAALRAEDVESPPAERSLRDLVIGRMEAGEPLAGLDLQNADLSDLDLSTQSLAGSDLSGAKLDRANLTCCDATGANFAGATFLNAVLEQALLGKCDLTNADLSEARASKALFDGVEARGLKARGADLTEAMLGGSVLADADLSEATLDRADLDEADLSGCRLDGASLRNALMFAVRLYGARAQGAVFDGAEMVNARAEAAAFERCSFREVSADESIWEKAELSQSIFFGATLKEASFVRAACEKTLFSEADLANARLRKSRMIGAIFVRANLLETNCDRASFEGADLRGANLHGASLIRADLRNARLDEALVTYTLLDKRQPV